MHKLMNLQNTQKYAYINTSEVKCIKQHMHLQQTTICIKQHIDIKQSYMTVLQHVAGDKRNF
jgi:hypothetical protein